MDLPVIFADHIRIVRKPVRNIQKAHDPIHGGADVVTHPDKKITAGFVSQPQFLVFDLHLVHIKGAAAYHRHQNG